MDSCRHRTTEISVSGGAKSGGVRISIHIRRLLWCDSHEVNRPRTGPGGMHPYLDRILLTPRSRNFAIARFVLDMAHPNTSTPSPDRSEWLVQLSLGGLSAATSPCARMVHRRRTLNVQLRCRTRQISKRREIVDRFDQPRIVDLAPSAHRAIP